MNGVWVLTDGRYLRQRMPAALAEELRRRGAPVRVLRSDRLVAEVMAGGCIAGGLDPGSVLVPRTRDPFALSLLRQAELAGVRTINTSAAVQAVRDKPHAALVLAGAGIPTPRTFLTDQPASLASLPAAAFPLLVKPSFGDNARGIVRVDSPDELRELQWRDGMVLAQHYVDVAGVDIKVYGAGDRIWAVRRPSPLTSPGCDQAVPVPATPPLRQLARACRDAFGLEFYGIDVLPARPGPLVVDVNDFPNYTGVPQAPQVLADHVLAALSRPAAPSGSEVRACAS